MVTRPLILMKRFIFSLCLLGLVAASTAAAAEEDYYRLTRLPIPEGIHLEAGAIQLLPDRRIAVATRFGDIYFIEGAFEETPTADNVKYVHFAEGLHEVLGLTLDDGWLYATQRGEVTRMKDRDGDGRADVFETVSDQWGINGDYHEYAFGSKMNADGEIWVAFCLTGSFTSENPYRGWCLSVAKDGTTRPIASGLRSPGGIGTNHLGEVFYTDNQGPWNGTCTLKHLVPGSFQGNPSGNRWYSATDALGPRPENPEDGGRIHIEAEKIPEFVPPPVWFPYNKMGQSASGLATDGTGGKFGPFANQIFVGDQTHSTVMRVFMEKVNGRYQGVCFPFREGFGSGTLSLEFAPGGSLFVGGTDRGWGARGGNPFSLERLDWTGATPFEIHEMRARPDGFELTFTRPVDRATVEDVASYTIETYTYIYQSGYGSPEVDHTKPVIRSATAGEDGKSVRLVIDGLQEGHIHEMHFPGVRDGGGEPLLHPEAYYTMNYIPER